MQDIYVDAIHLIDDFDKAIQANPGVIVDRNAKILLNRAPTQIYASQTIRFIQLVQTITRHRNIEVARDRELTDRVGRRIDRHHYISLGKIRPLEFLVGIAAQQENIDARTAQNAAVQIRVGIFFTLSPLNCLANNMAHRTSKIDLIIAEPCTAKNQQDGEETNHHARPDRNAVLLALLAAGTFTRRDGTISSSTAGTQRAIAERPTPHWSLGIECPGNLSRDHRTHARRRKARP